MARLVVFLGLGLVVVQGLTSGQFNQLLQAIGLQPSAPPTRAGAVPPPSNAPTFPGIAGAGAFGQGLASSFGLDKLLKPPKQPPTLGPGTGAGGSGGGGSFTP